MSKGQNIQRVPQTIVMLVPGGTEHAGGIGRWAGYLLGAWNEAKLAPAITLVDTRGHGGWLIGLWRFAATLLLLARLRATRRMGLLHLNLSADGSTVRKYIVSLLARAFGIPYILHLHSGRYFDFYGRLPRWAAGAVRDMFQHAARVLTLGQGWADQVAGTLGVAPGCIHVMPNGVAAAGPAGAASAPGPDQPAEILFLGRLSIGKGVPELLTALGSAALAGMNWHATIAGDGDQAAYLAQVAKSGIADRVTFTGWLDGAGVAAALARATLLVLPSYKENLPVCVVEALASRIAVVTTRVGALPELLTEGDSVCFVPIGDSAALGAAMARLLADPALRERIAAGGHAVFAERLDIAAQAVRLQALYGELMADTP